MDHALPQRRCSCQRRPSKMRGHIVCGSATRTTIACPYIKNQLDWGSLTTLKLLLLPSAIPSKMVVPLEMRGHAVHGSSLGTTMAYPYTKNQLYWGSLTTPKPPLVPSAIPSEMVVSSEMAVPSEMRGQSLRAQHSDDYTIAQFLTLFYPDLPHFYLDFNPRRVRR